jgi:hypothetical protein
VRVEYSSRGSWRTLFSTTTDARGYFTRTVNFRAGRRYRVAWTGPDGRTVHGATTSVYDR